MVKFSKYKSNKIENRFGKFDSKKEFNRFLILQDMEKHGEISDLQRQAKFELIPSQKDGSGKVIERPVNYKADFVYTENGKQVVEDVKGLKTKEYIIKRKLMLYLKGIRIVET